MTNYTNKSFSSQRSTNVRARGDPRSGIVFLLAFLSSNMTTTPPTLTRATKIVLDLFEKVGCDAGCLSEFQLSEFELSVLKLSVFELSESELTGDSSNDLCFRIVRIRLDQRS